MIDVRIGLWGAPSSGKTTLLAALPLAAQQSRMPGDSWNVFGADARATSWLNEEVGRLMGGRFSPATALSTRLSLVIAGERQPDYGTRVLRTRITVDVLDVPGDLFQQGVVVGAAGAEGAAQEVSFDGAPAGGGGPPVAKQASGYEELLRHLTACDGIILLFDPIREIRDRNSYTAFNAVLSELLQRCYQAGRVQGGKLPHHLFVCVTKFDDPRVMNAALTPGELAELSRRAAPVIDQSIAGRYFDQLADRPGTGAGHVRAAIRSAFRRERVEFYATSSIGFRAGPGRPFNPHHYQKTVLTQGETRIVGEAAPVGVLEPFLRMAGKITRQRGGPAA
ncbi:hypothetical protein [Frankia sp. AvcI1]|uniref:hypothetical protein n=1 Tax=Frankia sp. AvcI1 TaxID=573496 RepID=UPI0021179309|nr:hypothetical protein [Frankia sp. AvcI1]